MCTNQRKYELLSFLLFEDCEKSEITCGGEIQSERLHTDFMFKPTNAV